MPPKYHFKRTKQVDLKANTVTYTLKLTTLFAEDPGDDASIELFEEYVKQLKLIRRSKKKASAP